MLKNSFFNLIGLGVPLIVAVFSIPILIDELGVERFGLLTLIWAIVSYFGLFDLGLGRALTLFLSRLIATNDRQGINSVVWTALWVMLGLGLVSGYFLFLSKGLWVEYIDSSIGEREMVTSIMYMAIAVPFIVLTAGYRGILESEGAFLLINAIRIPMGIFTFIGPLLVVLYWQPNLANVALVLSIGRVMGCVVHVIAVHYTLPELVWPPVFKRNHMKPLFAVGGWITVSNIVSPFMGYIDRFLIGFLVSASAVAYYATPNEMITKLWIIPGALTAVLFPQFVTELTKKNGNIKNTFLKASGLLFSVIFPICMVLFIFAHEILELWLTKEFADESYVVLRLFCIGIMINCMAHIPYIFIQSTGDTKSTALIQLAELPFYIVLLAALLNIYGVMGAAVAWTLRMIIDAAVMFYVGGHRLKMKR